MTTPVASAPGTRQAAGLDLPDAAGSESTPTITGALRLAAQVLAGLTTVVIMIAAITRAAAPTLARRWLAYRFTGVPARADVFAGIFLHNALVLAGILSLVLVRQARYRTVGRPIPVRFERAARRAADWLMGSATAVNLAVIGSSLGAYGSRMVRAMPPHGPVEVSAFALGLALYIQGRDQRLTVEHVTKVAGIALVGLSIAAALETYVSV